MPKQTKRTARNPRKTREGRTVLVKWLRDFYMLSLAEYDLACIWVATKGESLAWLPYGRKITCMLLELPDRSQEASPVG